MASSGSTQPRSGSRGDDASHAFPLTDMGHDPERLDHVGIPSAVTPLTAGEPWEHLMDNHEATRNGEVLYFTTNGSGLTPNVEESPPMQDAAGKVARSRSPRQISLMDKLGGRAALVLLFSPPVLLGTLGFIAFLWFGNHNNATWHRFMIKSWVTRAVSISAVVLRLATSLLAGVGVAMLAALALELYGVPFFDAAAVAVMRSGDATPRSLFTQTVAGHRKRPSNVHWVYTSLAVVLFASTTLLQLISTALLSDLKLGPLPGTSSPSALNYDFMYNMTAVNQKQNFIPLIRRSTLWERNPQFYPTFAEFSSPAPPRSDVDDTGILLRAFLPLTDSQQRQTLRNYTGKAFVLDSRVACQKPSLTALNMSWDPSSGSVFSMAGAYKNSTSSQNLLTPEEPVPFNCPSYFYSNGYTICQLANVGNLTGNPAGALQSTFRAGPSEGIFGAPYLVFNSSINVITVTHDASPPLYLTHGQDLGVWSHWQVPQSETDRGDLSGYMADFNFTLCYTAFDTARLDVNLYSDSLRIEPLPVFDSSAVSYSFGNVLAQLGNNGTILGARDRNILTMEKQNWTPSPADALPKDVQPWVQATSNMFSVSGVSGKFINGYLSGNQSCVLDTADLWYTTPNMVNADPSLKSLFTEIMANNGSIAAAMSSFVTVLSSMAYYDQSAQFQTSDQVKQIYFETVLFPHYSRGFAAVVGVVCLQLAVVLVIVVMFWGHTHFTLIGNAWQSVAQIVTPLTKELLDDSTLAKDSKIVQQMKREGSAADRVKVAPLQDADGRRYGLVADGLTKRRSRI